MNSLNRPLPAFVAYTLNSSGKSMKKMTIAFFLGLATLFTLLGMSATFVGGFLKSQIILSSRITGIVIILFGVYILAGKGFSGFKFKARKPVSYIGSYFFGAAMGLSWTPCVGPILVSILLLASTTNSVFSGGFLLFLYAFGLAVPLFLFSHYLDKKGRAWKFIEGKFVEIEVGKWVIKTHTNTLISGFLFILIGYLILSGWLFAFNQYVGTWGVQEFIYGIEDWLLGLLK